MSLKGN